MLLRRFAAVVVNYESGGLLTECVRSLLDDVSGGVPELVVVDNGSRDGSTAALRRDLTDADVRVLDPGRNLGYSAAANRGIAATSAPVVVVCNPDLRVRPGLAAAMLARFDAEADLGALGPAIRNADGTPYPSARSVPTLADAVGHAALGVVVPRNRFTARYRQLDADPASPRDVDWVSGAMLWLRRSALDDVGGWDERYFMYMEDVDLCWRLRHRGWRVAYEPGGVVVHARGTSTARRPYRMIVEHHRSVYRFVDAHWRGARRALLPVAAAFLAGRAVVVVAVRAVAARARAPRATG